MFEQTFKNIDDILFKDSGADYDEGSFGDELLMIAEPHKRYGK